jgi:hypothetical protein
MKLFHFWEADQKNVHWLIHQTKSTGIGAEAKQRYQALVCPSCGKFSHDEAFRVGFDDEIKVRVRGDIFRSDDGFLCVNQRFRDLLLDDNCSGVAFKPVGQSGWSVLNVSLRVDVTPDVFIVTKPPCEACGRNRGVSGDGVQHEGQLLEIPKHECFFHQTAPRGPLG